MSCVFHILSVPYVIVLHHLVVQVCMTVLDGFWWNITTLFNPSLHFVFFYVIDLQVRSRANFVIL